MFSPFFQLNSTLWSPANHFDASPFASSSPSRQGTTVRRKAENRLILNHGLHSDTIVRLSLCELRDSVFPNLPSVPDLPQRIHDQIFRSNRVPYIVVQSVHVPRHRSNPKAT